MKNDKAPPSNRALFTVEYFVAAQNSGKALWEI